MTSWANPGGGRPSARPAGGLAEVLFSFQTGGSELLGRSLAEQAHERGIPVSVCATHGESGPVSAALEAAGIPCLPLQAGGGGRIGRGWRLFRHLRDRRTAVLHVHHFNMLAIAYWPARLAGVRRIVVTEHTDYELQRSRRARSVARRYGRRADAVTAVHGGLAAILVDDVGLPEDLVHVIPNGIDTTRFTPGSDRDVRSELGIPKDALVVGGVGRLHPDKDPVNLVRGFAAADLSRGHLLVVGDGESRADVERAIEQTGIGGRATLAGERDDVVTLLRMMDVFVLPSRTEGVPIALLEAMSVGLPVVATEVGGVAEAVGDGGVVVPPEDPSALGAAISRFAADDAYRRECAVRARERAVRCHERSTMFRSYAEVLSSPEDLLSWFDPADGGTEGKVS